MSNFVEIALWAILAPLAIKGGLMMIRGENVFSRRRR